MSLALSVGACFAQISIKVQAPEVVGLNEEFNLAFIISGENSPSKFEWQPGDDFEVLWGPQESHSTSISIINGNRTKNVQTSYTYILRPKTTGQFRISPASAIVRGEEYSSKALTIEVVTNGAGSSGGGSQSGQGGNPSSSSTQASVSEDDIFLRLTVDKSRVVVGEPVRATLKLYQRVNIAGFENARFPTFNGFWSQELEAPANIEFNRETINDRIYNAALLRSWTLVPQKAGEITIEPAELVCLVNIRLQRAPTGSIFDSFFQDDYQTIRERVRSQAVKVKVNPLPSGAPASFGGGVGSFKMSAELSCDSLKAHDAASLKITITGSGNVALLEAPKLSFPPDFEQYDVKSSDIPSGKVFEYPFIPRSHGSFEIGPVEYSYYDVSKGRYETLRSQVMRLGVAKNADGQAYVAQPQSGMNLPARKGVKDLGSDIRYIVTKQPPLRLGSAFFLGSTLFWLLLVLLLVGAAAIFALFRYLAHRRKDLVAAKDRGAVKMARKRLQKAGEYLSGGLVSAFYEELHRALLGFVADKLNLEESQMSRENIAAGLESKGVAGSLAEEFCTLLDACEFARYAPSQADASMDKHYQSSIKVISEIDSNMKKGKKTPAGLAAIAILLCCSGSLFAQTGAEGAWERGVEAYSASDYLTAIENWKSLSDAGYESAQLYYNLGNACFKNDDLAHSILYYERALKLNPSYGDAKYNLEYARSMVQDRIEAVPEFFLKTWTRSFSYLLPSNAWTALFLVFLATALAMGLMYLLSRRKGARKTGFILGIVFLLLSAGALSFAAGQKSDYLKQENAIVMRPVSTVRSSPDSYSSKDLFVLHEGTKVKVLDRVGDWVNIELSDGRQGWARASEIEII